MFSEAKVTEIYCMADDFAKNLYCNRKNIYRGFSYSNLYKVC